MEYFDHSTGCLGWFKPYTQEDEGYLLSGIRGQVKFKKKVLGYKLTPIFFWLQMDIGQPLSVTMAMQCNTIT